MALSMPVYNSLKHITEANLQGISVHLDLVQLIEEYKLGNLLGVSHLHRHFLIDHNEKVVWTFQERSAQSEVKKNEQAHPFLLMLKDKNWISVEYHAGEKDIWSEILNNERNGQFFDKAIKLIEGAQMEIGLILKLGPRNVKMLETTNEQLRIQFFKEDHHKNMDCPCRITTQFYANDLDADCFSCSN